jgi:hypothetical protein
MESIAILHEDNGHKELITLLIEHLKKENTIKFSCLVYLKYKDKNYKNHRKLKMQKKGNLGVNFDISLIQFYPMGTKSNFFKLDCTEYKILKQRVSRNQVKKILFVADADYKKDNEKTGGLKNTESALNEVICELGFQDICQIYVPRDSDEEGYLESLVLSSLPQNKKDCIERFVKCSQINPKKIHKTILYRIYKVAYPDPPYNFAHRNFDELKTKLTQLFIEST